MALAVEDLLSSTTARYLIDVVTLFVPEALPIRGLGWLQWKVGEFGGSDPKRANGKTLKHCCSKMKKCNPKDLDRDNNI